jgi:hypothetical protein
MKCWPPVFYHINVAIVISWARCLIDLRKSRKSRWIPDCTDGTLRPELIFGCTDIISTAIRVTHLLLAIYLYFPNLEIILWLCLLEYMLFAWLLLLFLWHCNRRLNPSMLVQSDLSWLVIINSHRRSLDASSLGVECRRWCSWNDVV